MSRKDIPVLTGAVVEEELVWSLGELCRVCSVRTEFVVELVEQGALEPDTGGGARVPNPEPEQWRFSGSSLKRVRTALRLHRDLGVNAAGAALILDLLEEIEQIRARLNEPH